MNGLWRNVLPQDYDILVSLGKIPGASFFSVVGENPDVDVGSVPEDIWDGGGLYTFTSDNGANYYLSSSSILDNQYFLITAMTKDSSENWNLEIFPFQVQGQTKTQIIPPSGDVFVRIFRAYIITSPTQNGDIYFYEDDTVIGGVPQTASKIRAISYIQNNRTNLSMFTVPSNKIGLLHSIDVSLAGSVNASSVVDFMIRVFGSVPQRAFRASISSNGSPFFSYIFTTPEAIPEKTDLWTRCSETSANNTIVTGGMGIKLVDNN